jgi:hypothetical protein
MSDLPDGTHDYLSTACLHELHDYCQCDTRPDGQPKIPGKCKFCDARCRCACHRLRSRPDILGAVELARREPVTDERPTRHP